MRIATQARGIALITVLLTTALLLVLVGVLVDLGTIQLERSTEDLRALQALAGADAGTGWVRAVVDDEKGDASAAMARLAQVGGKRRIVVDGDTYVLVSVLLMWANQTNANGDHVDDNLEQNPQVVEFPAQVQSSATVFVRDVSVARRSTTTLLRIFPAAPYSEVAGVIDDGGPVGILSPGDAAGQTSAPGYTELLVHAYTVDANDVRHLADQFGNDQWSDGNSSGSGPLP